MTYMVFDNDGDVKYNSDDMEYDTTKSIYHDMAHILLQMHLDNELQYKVLEARPDYLKIININGWIAEFSNIAF